MKKLLLLAIALCAPVSSFAVALPYSVVPTAAMQFELDRFMAPFQKYSVGSVLREAHTTAVGTYDFAVLGGAIGTVNVGALLPPKAIVTNVFVDTVTALTSGGSATLSFGVSASAANLKAALAYGSYTGRLAGAVVYGTPAGYVKVGSSASQVTASIAAAAITAGKVKVFVSYVVSE